MKSTAAYQNFMALAEQLDIRVVIGRGEFAGDFCVVGEDKYIVINKNKPMEQKLRRFAVAFARIDLSRMYVKPAIREMIENERARSIFSDSD